MKAKIFVTSSGYDPEKGKDVKDPYLGPKPSLGACRPDIRRQLQKGDQIFVVSGKVRNVDQFVIGGFEIEEKIDVLEAYRRFPEQRLRLCDGQVTGNIIVDANGKQHELDHHKTETFDERVKNYVVGCNPIALPELRSSAIRRRGGGLRGRADAHLPGVRAAVPHPGPDAEHGSQSAPGHPGGTRQTSSAVSAAASTRSAS